MTFAQPIYLTLLAMLPAAMLFLKWADRRRKTAIAWLGDQAVINRLLRNVNWRGRKQRTGLWFTAVALLIVALARPQWGSTVQQIEQEGLQVMVALDVSNSMLAEDVKPNRLERAKLEISDLMDKLNGDEVGLVLFSGASFIQFPLTSDYVTARNYLDNANPSVISRSGTAIGDAIQTAMRGFDDNLNSQKVLIIMTDGENQEDDPLPIAQQAADAGVLLYTIGFGTPEGEPIPELDRSGNQIGFKMDQSGEFVISRLDAATLQQIATIGGGAFYQAGAGGSELDQLLNDMAGLQRAALESRLEATRIERYQLFLAASLIALMAAELIPDRVTQRFRLSDRLNRKRRYTPDNATLGTEGQR